MPTPQEKQQKKLYLAVEKYLKENSSLLKKHRLTSRIVMQFPGKKTWIVRFAMRVLVRHGAVMDTEFTLTQ